MKYLFLDIDGVLNSAEGFRRKECTTVKTSIPFKNNPLEFHQYEKFQINSKLLIQKLIKEFNLQVVISSTWRKTGLNFLKEVWLNEMGESRHLEITPDSTTKFYNQAMLDSFNEKTRINRPISESYYSTPRGFEIERYLAAKGFYHINYSREEQLEIQEKSGVENYVIIDDDSDMLYGQRNHFVKPDAEYGFSINDYHKAYSILSKDVARLNYEI